MLAVMTAHRNRLQIHKLDGRRKLHIATAMHQTINNNCPDHLDRIFSNKSNINKKNHSNQSQAR